MYAFKDRDLKTREPSSDEHDEIIKLYLENQYSCNDISRYLHIHSDVVREIIWKHECEFKREDLKQELSSERLLNLRKTERNLRISFHRQLESLIGKHLNELDKIYVDEQIAINDVSVSIIPNETCEYMQKRLTRLFRKIITHFTPCDDEIEKQLGEIFKDQ